MKKTIITCLTLLAISLCLFVSCSAENEAVNEINDVAYVTFGRDSRGDFSASYEVQGYDTLYWFYTAKKVDNYGTTGVTSGAAVNRDGKTINKGIGSKTVGPFSQGQWTFTLQAYAGESTPDMNALVYESGKINVTLKGGETKAIPVTVSPVGNTGTIKFENAFFNWKDGQGGDGVPCFKIEAVGKEATYILTNDTNIKGENIIPITLTKSEGKYTIAFVGEGTSTSTSIPAPVDYYTCTAYAYINKEEANPLAKSIFGLRVYGNATTIVSGSLFENPDSKVSFDVAASDIKTFSGNNGEKKVEVKVAPVSGESTIVDFTAANNIIDKDATYAVNVEALTANAANDAFQISTSFDEEGKKKEVLGSVKLSLTQIKDGVATEVKKFGDNGYVTVSTYIGTGLKGTISVVYNGKGDAPIFEGEGLGYSSDSGIITFKTNHFSEFFIVRDGNVKNEDQNKYYYSLEDAVDNAGSFDEITLINNITLNEILTIKDGKSIVINMNSKMITRNEKTAISIHDALVTFTGEGTIQGGNNSIIIEAVKNEETYLSIGKDITLMAGEDGAGLGIFNYDDKLTPYKNVTVDFSGKVKSGAFGITVNGLMIQQNNATVINIYDGASLVGTGSGIYAAGYAEWNIDNAYVEGSSALEVRAGNVNINGGTYKATSEEYKCISNPSGQTTDGVAIAIAQHTTRLPISVNITGGKFTGLVAFSEQDPQDGEAKDITVSITGGEFTTTDTSEKKQVVVSADLEKFISGGKFNNRPADNYIADGYFYASNGTILKAQGTAKVNGEDIKIANISDVVDFNDVKNITIDLDKDASLTLDNGDFNEGDKSKNITLVGKLDDYGNPCTTIDVTTEIPGENGNLYNYQRGSSFTFKNLTIEAGEGNYRAIVCDSLDYENCIIKGRPTLSCKTATFTNCVFENYNDYCIWTYGANEVSFNGCTFKTGGKAIYVYNEMEKQSFIANITVTNCVFNDNGTLKEKDGTDLQKAAVETGSNGGNTETSNKYNLVLSGNTVNGFGFNNEGIITNSKLWANKHKMDKNHLTVTIDGTEVYGPNAK